MTPDPLPDHSPLDAAWDEIYRLVNEVSALTETDISADDFYAHLLDRAVQAMAAVGGAVWRQRKGEWTAEYSHVNPHDLFAAAGSREKHARLLHAIAQQSDSQALAPESVRDEGLRNPTEHLLLIGSVRHRDKMLGIIEIFQRPTLHPTVQRGNLRLLDMLREIAVDYHRNRELTALRRRELDRESLNQFAFAIHQATDLRTTAFAIANEGRRVLRCDRLSVIQRRRSRFTTLAVSGVDVVDRRANAVEELELLAKIACNTGHAIKYGARQNETPVDVADAVQQYVDRQGIRSLAVIPLTAPETKEANSQGPIGAIVIERFDADFDAGFSDRLEQVRQHSLIALQKASEVARIPLLRVLRWLSQTTLYLFVERLPRTLLLLAPLVALLLAVFLIPAEFRVRARGELQPLVRRDIFAPIDGQIVELNAGHDQSVAIGEELALLRSVDLEVAIQSLEGELETISKGLKAIASERVLNDREASRDGAKRSQLAAEEEQLRIDRDSKQQQLTILREQSESLRLRSPLAGRVLTWDVDQLLAGRPVRRGQALLAVAEVDGPWILELNVPDDQIDHVLTASHKQDDPLAVTFIVMNEPEIVYEGHVKEIAGTVSTSDHGDPSVLVTVEVDRDALTNVRPGTTVVGKVHCGQGSLGSVWLHELFETIHTWIFF